MLCRLFLWCCYYPTTGCCHDTTTTIGNGCHDTTTTTGGSCYVDTCTVAVVVAVIVVFVGVLIYCGCSRSMGSFLTFGIRVRA